MLLGTPALQPSAADRRLGKLVNFGVLYGMGASGLARAAGVGLPAAREFLDGYQRFYPSAFSFMERCKLQAVVDGHVTVGRTPSCAPPRCAPAGLHAGWLAAHAGAWSHRAACAPSCGPHTRAAPPAPEGHSSSSSPSEPKPPPPPPPLQTLMGRRRLFNFSSPALRALRGDATARPEALAAARPGAGDAQLLRAAANAPVQGSSADLLRAAMVELAARLDPGAARLLLTVHDEVVLEVAEGEAERVAGVVREVMEGVAKLDVPLLVNIKTGGSWAEL
jgi:DNA polymerase I-like protein with 3'-5' exonuclease and polymerase domains